MKIFNRGFKKKSKRLLNNTFSIHKSKEINSRNKHEYLGESQFNQLIRNFNEFIILTSDKIESREDVSFILESCKKLNFKPIKTLFLPYYSSTEFIEEVKQKVLESFLTIINNQNELMIKSDINDEELDQFTRGSWFKAFIEKGNNGTAVKTILNRRSWWSIQETHDENYESSDFMWTQWNKQKIFDNLPTSQQRIPFNSIYNKIEANHNLSDKKDLFLNLESYYKSIGVDSSENIPLTFLIEGGKESDSFNKFRQYYNLLSSSPEEDNKWILKPGENSNRGQNIMVWQDIAQIEAYVETGTRSWYIIQKYIHNPLLINKRKFDIRWYALLSAINGKHYGFFYQDGYLRTASKEYDAADVDDKFMHLTNDAIQK